MQLEMTLLRMLSNREAWSKLKGAIPRGGLDENTKALAGRISEYYKAFPDVQEIDADAFSSWYFSVKTNLDEEAKAIWRKRVQRMSEPVPPEIADGMYERLLELAAGSKIQDLLAKYTEGEDVALMHEISSITDEFKANRRTKDVSVIVDSNVLDLMDAAAQHKGIKWRLPIFNEYMRPMAGGDFIGVAARPDNGKTSFLTDSLSYFGPQIVEHFGENRPATWFCNEGAARKIWMRMYQSALGMSMTELGAFRRDVCKSNDTKFLDAVYKAIGGEHMIQIVDANKMTNIDIEDHIAKHNPAIVVYDMIDNVHFVGSINHNGSRTDQVLESMYKWAREIGVAQDFIGFATSQISGDGEGLAFPAKSMLKDSKTGKQGTFDTQLMIGASNSGGMQDIRYFSTPKNKLRVDGSPSNMQVECFFDGMRGRFKVGERTSYKDSQEDDAPVGKIADANKPAKVSKDDPLGGDI